ncbi:hypothetical protein L3Q82_015373 [Scortum barcoo]|uniref:Uncharacterized protein n=1 Tax=Scortum barcoo TaxID=214431 RepID=A0ACB8VTQ9_9TELE|nr:hypothetical protein L3Q82_015373 [Scortum barcoo]
MQALLQAAEKSVEKKGVWKTLMKERDEGKLQKSRMKSWTNAGNVVSGAVDGGDETTDNNHLFRFKLITSQVTVQSFSQQAKSNKHCTEFRPAGGGNAPSRCLPTANNTKEEEEDPEVVVCTAAARSVLSFVPSLCL